MINVTDKYINLATSESGAEIRYTLDGTDPSLSSTLYSGTMSLGEGQILKARTFKNGSPASNITRYFPSDEFSYRVLGSIPSSNNGNSAYAYRILEIGKGEYLATSYPNSGLTAYLSKDLKTWTAASYLPAKTMLIYKLKEGLGYAVMYEPSRSNASVSIYPTIWESSTATFTQVIDPYSSIGIDVFNPLITDKFVIVTYLRGSSVEGTLLRIDNNGNISTSIPITRDNAFDGLGYNPISNTVMASTGFNNGYLLFSNNLGSSFTTTTVYRTYGLVNDLYGNIYYSGYISSGTTDKGLYLMINSSKYLKLPCDPSFISSSSSIGLASSPYIFAGSGYYYSEGSLKFCNVYDAAEGNISIGNKDTCNLCMILDENNFICTQVNGSQTDVIEVHIGPTTSSNGISAMSFIDDNEPEWIPCKITYNTN